MKKGNRFATGVGLLKLLAAVLAGGLLVKLILGFRRSRTSTLPLQEPLTSPSPPEAPSVPSTVSSSSVPESGPPEARREDPLPNGLIDLDEVTKQELYERAKELDIHGRSKMNKEELAEAIEEHESS